MKIFHGKEPPFSDGHGTDYCKREANAYRRLRDKGVCKAGLVPEFLGVIEKMPSACEGWAKEIEEILDSEDFWEDELPQAALFLEFIPDMQELSLYNCTEERLRAARHALDEVHKANVCHDDIVARNIAVASNRTMLFDFDLAITYPEGPLDSFDRESLDENDMLFEELQNIL
ncbi:hypothetical protein KEM55_005589, partial [Ascosphaera atra]